MSLLTSLLILIALARILGQIFSRFNQPAIVGEMLAGIVLGPTVLNLINVNQGLSAISDLAIFFVLLSAGLETNFKSIADALRGKASVIAILGFFLPLVGGAIVGYLFSLDTMKILFLGLCVSITALPVAIRILKSFNLMDTPLSNYTIATAIFNDVIALFILGVLLGLPEKSDFHTILFSILSISWKFALLFGLILAANWYIQRLIKKKIRFEHIQEKLVDFLGNQAIFGILVLFVLIFGSISEALGFQFIIGVFFAALLLDKKLFLASHYEEFERNLAAISEDFLAPVFFAFLGLEFSLGAMYSIWFVLTVLFVSILSKILAGWLGGRLIHISHIKSFGIGIVLNGRGVMELVIASIGYERGLIDQGLFSVLVLMGIVTTIITPIMFRSWVMPRLEPEQK